jgi:multimeric flavodoxin WrbA
MNYVIINGSYRKKGNTFSLVDSLIKGIKQSDSKAKLEIINLIDQKVEFCKGCTACFKVDGKDLGTCVQKDGFDKILRSMLECDRLVFATPIYEANITARLKRFCERSMPLFYSTKTFPKPRNKKVKGKKGLVVMSSGAGFPFNIIFGLTKQPAKILSFFLKSSTCSSVKKLPAGGFANKKSQEKFINKAFKLGLEFGQ